jgi:hypothetical protein
MSILGIQIPWNDDHWVCSIGMEFLSIEICAKSGKIRRREWLDLTSLLLWNIRKNNGGIFQIQSEFLRIASIGGWMIPLDTSHCIESQLYHHFSSNSFCKGHLRCSSNQWRRIFGGRMIGVGPLLENGVNCMRTLSTGIPWLNRCATRS